ncbi:MAG: cell division protein FtsA [bacterium]|nr:cell division protein FtsA [bacterium]
MKDYICAIDIGSSLCQVLVGRPLSESAGDRAGDHVEVIGVGTAPTRGVRSGSIVNIEATVQAVSEAVREAELMSGLAADEILINITGKHLKGDNSRGVIAVTNKERIVSESDVLRVIEGAQNIRIPADQEIIHVLSREFTVDDQTGIKDPVGMTGIRLEADVHIVTAGVTALTNFNKVVSGAGLNAAGGVMSSLASAEAVLDPGEKDLGVAVIDIGGGICDIVMYVEGGVIFSSVVPLGGIHVTQDLSIGLKAPMEVAEVVKKNYGAARSSVVDPTEKIELPGIPGRPPRWVLRQQLAGIIEPRMVEILEMIDTELLKSGKKNFLAGGVVLTGGGSLLEGMEDLAEETLGLSVTVRSPMNVEGFVDRVSTPEFATSVGILHYTSRVAGAGGGGWDDRQATRSSSSGGGHSMADRIRNWISENL